MIDPHFPDAILLAERRRFLRSALVLGAASVVGCGGSPSAPASKPQDGTDATPPPNDAGALDATPQCADTEDNIEGPFFKPGSLERTNLLEPGITGTVLHLSGRVFEEGCGAPLAGALLDFWQANDAGAYDDVALRGHQYAGDDGGWTLTTIIPGHYLNGSQYRPSHVHVKVGGVSGYRLLTTQLYFDGDPYNAIDPFIKPSLVMTPAALDDGSKKATFDFVIQKA